MLQCKSGLVWLFPPNKSLRYPEWATEAVQPGMERWSQRSSKQPEEGFTAAKNKVVNLGGILKEAGKVKWKG